MAGTKRDREESIDASSKKMKGKQYFNGQKTANIIIEGKEDEPFCVHADIFSAYSEEFKIKLANSEEGQEQKPLKIKHVSPETLDAFIRWMYAAYGGVSPYRLLELDAINEAQQKYDYEEQEDSGVMELSTLQGESEGAEMVDEPKELNWVRKTAESGEASNHGTQTDDQTPTAAIEGNANHSAGDHGQHLRERLGGKQRAFLDLVDLYIFGARYKVVALRRVVMLTLQRLVEDWKLLPCYFVVQRAVDSLTIEAPLCRYLVECCAYYDEVPTKLFPNLPSDFLTELLHLVKDPNSSDEGLTYDVARWCDYHEHEDNKSRQACFESRREERKEEEDYDSEDERATIENAKTDIEGKPVAKPKSKTKAKPKIKNIQK